MHGAAERMRAFARPWELACFVWVPAIALTYAFLWEMRARRALQDFAIFRTAAAVVVHGRSPYVAANAHALAGFDKFVYPPAAAFFFSPFTVIPAKVATLLMLVAGLACILGALRLLGVEDWRCYGVALLSAPVVNSLALGALTSFLLVGAAAVWRFRSRPAISGSAAALTAVAKVFLWPLGVWLLATRRLRAAALCAGVAVAVVLGGWAAIGFAGLRSYPQLLRVLSRLEGGESYGPLALFRLSQRTETALSLALVLAVVALVVVTARGYDGDRRSFVVAVIGALVVTPVLWLHYFALLLIPIALYRPRLSGLWFLPLGLWLTPSSHSHGESWRIALGLAVVATVAVRSLREPA